MGPRTISILGCGWVGLPLGAHLAAQGHRVKGSTTSPDKLDTLRAVGIEPYRLRLDPDLEDDPRDFFEADVLVLNIPPGRRRPDVETRFPRQVEAVRKAMHAAACPFVVFVSSTSVYPNVGRVVTEEDAGPAPTGSGRALLVAEQRLLNDEALEATVLRFGGLYGYDRHPGSFLAGRNDLPDGEAPVNMTHRDDAIAVIDRIITDDVRGEVFNVCADAHPTRRAYYTWSARELGLEPPTFADAPSDSSKIVSSAKLKAQLGYVFRHPDPMAAAR